MDGSDMSSSVIKDAGSATSSSPSNGNSRKSSSTESAEGEEQEDSCSSSSSTLASKVQTNLEDDLSSLRMKWQQELQISKGDKESESDVRDCEKKDNDGVDDEHEKEAAVEEQAKNWFLEGVENEKNKKLYEAISCYKKAVQLVPDIEFKLYESQRQKGEEETQPQDSSGALTKKNDHSEGNLTKHNDDEDEDDVDLLTKFQMMFDRSRPICEPEYEQKTTHICALPIEIILYIFRWVVSYDLDLRSLEMCSMVCRGFYLCSRDSEIWRIACLKVWGVNCGGLSNFNNWRMMYLARPRLNFNGCYISKTTYIRQGENSSQGQFQGTWHLVEYFRYLRFFPEGKVLMMTTPSRPVPVISLLKTREVTSPSILTGHYKLQDDTVTMVLHRQGLTNNNRYRGRRNNDLVDPTFFEQFHVIFPDFVNEFRESPFPGEFDIPKPD